jgi:hypothetical protein
MHILEDPAHLAVEVTMMIVLDGIILGLIWPVVKRFIDSRLERQHRLLDAEHGIQHHDDHVHLDAPSPVCDEAGASTERVGG